ncbi:MAG: ribulose-phosphate 3-epimerase [Oscillospiraceae bacterium]|nr:ribulose-phosphate 3-epimerase [Oscillospiraceae bacterium]
MKTKISASILSADFGHLSDELSRAEAAGCDMIHFDVMDGHFVANISYGVPVLKSIRKYSSLPFDVHLMISDPNAYIEPFAKAGADGITFHLEATANPVGIIEKIHSLGLRAGVSVKPKTDVSLLYPLVGVMDMALIMTVEPGFGGQGFIPETLAKIKALREYLSSENIDLDIEVDGGISDKTAYMVREAGANVLVSGSYLFRAADMASNCKLLKD